VTASARDDGASSSAGPALSANERQELVLKLVGLMAAGALEECPICMDDVTAPVITTCGHVFCRSCIENWLLNNEPAQCPLCRAAISKQTLVDAPEDAQAQPLSVKAVCYELCGHCDKVLFMQSPAC
jgi:Ring finger domain